MLPLADILPAPSGTEVLTFLSCIVLFLSIIVLWRKAFGKEERVPQPLIVSGETRMATHEELLKIDERVSDLEEEFRDEVKELKETIQENYNSQMESAAKGRSGLHKEINDVATTVHRIEGKLELLVSQSAATRN